MTSTSNKLYKYLKLKYLMKQNLQELFAEPLNVSSFTYDFKEHNEFPQELALCTNLSHLILRNCPEELVLPSFLADLPKLQSLDIAAATTINSLPAVLFKPDINQLVIRDVAPEQLINFKALLSLYVVVKEPFKDVDFIAQHFPDLKVLKIWGHHLATGSLPPSIQQFTALEELELVSCGLAHLPEELGQLQSLKKLKIAGLPMKYFPEVITQLSSLETLRFGQQVTSLPDTLPKLTQLKELNLYDSYHGYLNGSEDSLFDDPKSTSLPEIFAKLTSLESLNLGYCAIQDVKPLTQLPHLKHLVLVSTFITHLKDVAQISQLESLSIKSCDKIKDIEALAPLQSLKELDISNLYSLKSLQVIEKLSSLEKLNIKSCRRIQDLSVIYQHAQLTHLKADEKILEKWENRDNLDTPSDKDSIAQNIESGQLAEVQQGIKDLLVYLDQHGSEDESLLPEIFTMEAEDGYDEESMANLPQIEAMIKRFQDELSNEDYVNIFKACYQSIYHNFQPALDAFDMIARRNAIDSQKEIVNHFLELMEYYDGGHRFWGSTTLDSLIDDYLADFSSDALALLLENCSNDNLNASHGDAMDQLYIAAFNKVKDPTTLQSLLSSFTAYFEEMTEYEADYFTETLPITSILENSPPEVKAGLSLLTEKQSRLNSLIQDLESNDSEKVAKVIDQLGENIDLKSHEKIEDFILNALDKDQVSTSTILQYFSFVLGQALNFGHYGFRKISYRLAHDHFSAFQEWLQNHQEENNHATLKTLISYAIQQAYLQNNEELLPLLRELRKPFSTKDIQGDVNKDLHDLLKYLEANQRGASTPNVLTHFHYLKDAQGKVVGGYHASSVARTIIDMAGWAKKNNTDYEQNLIQNIPHFPKLEFNNKTQQQLLGAILKAVLNQKSNTHLVELIDQLPNPGDVLSKKVALQIACFYAWQENKTQVSQYLQKAVKLGISTTDISQHAAFEKYMADEQFLASLEVDSTAEEIEQQLLEALDQTMDRGEDRAVTQQNLQNFFKLLPRLKTLTTPILLDDLHTKHLYNVTVAAIHAGLSQSLTELIQYLPQLSISTHWLGEMLGNLLHAIAVNQDWGKLDALKNLLPQPFENARLAFNLACCYALNQQKPEMLEMSRLAIKLGKDKAQFLSEGDFESYWNDQEFLVAIEGAE